MRKIGRERTDMAQRGWLRIMTLVIMTTVSFSGCASPFAGSGADTPAPAPERVDTGFVVPGPDSYDSADTAILVDRDEKEGTLTFRNLDLGRNYTLSMDGTTRLYDKYGDAVSAEQIQKGDIVDITFLKSKKHLTTMQLSTKSWTYSNVEKYVMNAVRGEVSIGEETFKLTSDTQYLSSGRNIELMELNAADVLSFQGIDNQILSVRVEKGHGYLRLENDENFVGGWIEIGQTIIQRITADMLLLVPEGSYQVNISNLGGGGVKDVTIVRNEETLLDIGDLEVPEPQTGMVLFSLTPEETELYIDGAEVDTSEPVVLNYGLHQLIARAEGYQSVTRYIKVSEESAAINVVLDTAVEKDGDDSSSDSSTESSADVTTDYYKVYVDSPDGAEVYLDGNYVGVAPCSFRKVEGSHVITLRMAGRETRSYTVQVDNEEKDLTLSFADLAIYATQSGESSETKDSSDAKDSSGAGESSGTKDSSGGKESSETKDSSGGKESSETKESSGPQKSSGTSESSGT